VESEEIYGRRRVEEKEIDGDKVQRLGLRELIPER